MIIVQLASISLQLPTPRLSDGKIDFIKLSPLLLALVTIISQPALRVRFTSSATLSALLVVFASGR